MPQKGRTPRKTSVRVGEAAERLGVSVDTLRRWTASGRLRVSRSAGGQRLVSLADLRRLQIERRSKREKPFVAQSARNRFSGVVTRVQKDRVAAVVEVQAEGPPPRRLMTPEGPAQPPPPPRTRVGSVVHAPDVIVQDAQTGRGSMSHSTGHPS